ncbi:MAG: LamG-like jellyroll fold domain-containing protein, partial [Ferruginibacter sp.]
MRTILLLCFWVLYSASALSQNLVAYYPFNGNANDQSGNAINPTYIGAGVTLTTDRFGNANSAYNFDGLTGSYIRMPADLLPTTNRTISLWFNVTDVSNRPGLLGYGGNGSCGTTLIMGLNCTGTGTYFVQGHCGNNGAGYTYPAPPVNSWYHWVLTINGADQKIYVNGELKSTTSSFGGSTAVTGKDLALGVITSLNGTAPYTDANVGYTNGKLDDIRIYNAAMSDAQVMQLYNNESVGLVAFYPFNGNANDESGNGINSNYTGAGVSLNADRFGNANKAYYFNGAVGSYIRIPADNFPATNRTISFWFNADDPAVYRVPFSYGGNACNASCFLMILNQGGSGTYTKSGHCDVERIVVPYSTPPVNSWKQWVITVNGTVQKIYIDGILQSPSLIENFSTATYVPGRSVLLGAMVNTDGNSVYQDGIWNFKGKMDEFRIYNNAMTDAQVLSLYNSESTGMVAYYPFNGNANDESGNGNNGTVNGAVLTADRFNNTNRAYAFNGTSDYINVPDAATIRPGAEISLSAWVKRTRLGIDIIAEKGGDWTGGTCNYGMGLHNINNNMFYFYFNGGWRGTDGVSDLNWHHYVVVAKTGDVNPVLYIDGQPKPVLYSSGAGSIVMNNSAEDLHIGSQVGAATYYGANLIDELNIYRRNLSATEVQKIYNQSATGLVAYYPFNANANDESGNGNNGTVNGATLITDRFGNANKAYNFTNPNHISVPNTNMFGDEFSVSYWFKINSYFGQRGVMSNVAVPNGGFQQALDGTTFSYILGYNFPLTNDPLFSNYTMLEPLSQWHHVALTYKKTGAVSSETQLFINGELKRSNTHSLSISFTPNAMYYIGQNHSGLNFQGDLDDIKIYNRVLSPNEILQLADIPMMPDLLAYLPMNGNANDMSGNSRHGIVVNATATTDKYENNNAAYQFNGNGSGTSITLANSTSLDLLGTPFTISTWVKFSTATGEPKMIAGKHNCGSATGYFVGVDNNRLSYWLASGGSWSQVLTTETFNDNKWHHIVGTYDGVEQKLYVDGIFKAGTSTNYNTPASGAPIKVGEPSGACGGTGLFNGKVDELKMYNGALDVAQVKALYKQSRGSGNALKFDGVNDIVAIPNGGALNNLQTGTIDLWVKWNGINQDPSSGDAYGAITGRQLNSVFSNQIIALNGADPNNAGIIWKPYSSVATTMTSSLSPGNKWNHLAIVYSSGNHKMYLNGIEVASSIDAGTIADGAVPLTLGGWIDHGNCFANADLDEVRIWNIALTQTQIREWMNRKITAAHPAYSNLAGYYNFDEPHLQLAYDSKNGITGTMINGPSWVISGAAIGDTSAYDFINAIKTTTLTVAAGENFTATATGGAPSGISVYEVKDIPNTTNGTVGIGENDHYFGVHVSGGTAPQYTATYNYTGNIIVTPASEPTLQLYKRNNNSDTLWTNSGATLNMPANTLTITGQNTEYIIAAGGTEPVPDAVAAPQNQIICSGSSITTILITGSVPSTVFNWTRDNTTTVTGIAASGAGDISGTLTNTTNAAILVTFTITPTVGVITGTPITATVTVNPTATVTTVLNQVICNGAATPAVNFTSTATGGTIVYDWTNNTTSIGLAASGTGDIASFTAINATTAPVMATITVTPTYTNGGVSCAGTPSTFTITVNPTATVTTVPNQVVCN